MPRSASAAVSTFTVEESRTKESAESTSAALANPLLARAAELELPTEYSPPPGDALEHHTAGFAKILCSAVFLTGLDPDFARENVGYFIQTEYGDPDGAGAEAEIAAFWGIAVILDAEDVARLG